MNELKQLPVLEPPAEREATTLAAMAEAATFVRSAEASVPPRMRRLAYAAAWIAALGLGALAALTALNLDPPATESAARAEPDVVYSELLEESAYLEQVLAALPQREVMRVSTAGTIVGLETRIAMIDAELVRDDAESVPPEYRIALLRDRVDAMNALVSVRYAQSRVFGY